MNNKSKTFLSSYKNQEADDDLDEELSCNSSNSSDLSMEGGSKPSNRDNVSSDAVGSSKQRASDPQPSPDGNSSDVSDEDEESDDAPVRKRPAAQKTKQELHKEKMQDYVYGPQKAKRKQKQILDEARGIKPKKDKKLQKQPNKDRSSDLSQSGRQGTGGGASDVRASGDKKDWSHPRDSNPFENKTDEFPSHRSAEFGEGVRRAVTVDVADVDHDDPIAQQELRAGQNNRRPNGDIEMTDTKKSNGNMNLKIDALNKEKRSKTGDKKSSNGNMSQAGKGRKAASQSKSKQSRMYQNEDSMDGPYGNRSQWTPDDPFAAQEEEEDEFYEPLSYNKLIKVVEMYHPVDPETKEKFSVFERITVKEYRAKLGDCCYCYALGVQLKRCKKWFKKKLRGEREKKMERPESMADMPDSGSSSSSSEEEGARGLTLTSQCLGDGATLYLQSMKTFAIMFFILSIINIPIFIMYQSTTDNNDFSDIKNIFKFFTLGNLGRSNLECGFSDVKEYLIDGYKGHSPDIYIDCQKDGTRRYISKLEKFGLLYADDPKTGQPSSGEAACQQIKNPQAPLDFEFADENDEEEEVAEEETVESSEATTDDSEATGLERRQLTIRIKPQYLESKTGRHLSIDEVYFSDLQEATTVIDTLDESDNYLSVKWKILTKIDPSITDETIQETELYLFGRERDDPFLCEYEDDTGTRIPDEEYTITDESQCKGTIGEYLTNDYNLQEKQKIFILSNEMDQNEEHIMVTYFARRTNSIQNIKDHTIEEVQRVKEEQGETYSADPEDIHLFEKYDYFDELQGFDTIKDLNIVKNAELREKIQTQFTSKFNQVINLNVSSILTINEFREVANANLYKVYEESCESYPFSCMGCTASQKQQNECDQGTELVCAYDIIQQIEDDDNIQSICIQRDQCQIGSQDSDFTDDIKYAQHCIEPKSNIQPNQECVKCITDNYPTQLISEQDQSSCFSQCDANLRCATVYEKVDEETYEESKDICVPKEMCEGDENTEEEYLQYTIFDDQDEVTYFIKQDQECTGRIIEIEELYYQQGGTTPQLMEFEVCIYDDDDESNCETKEQSLSQYIQDSEAAIQEIIEYVIVSVIQQNDETLGIPILLTDTVYDLKQEIISTLGIDEDDIALTFDNKWVDDSSTNDTNLAHYKKLNDKMIPAQDFQFMINTKFQIQFLSQKFDTQGLDLEDIYLPNRYTIGDLISYLTSEEGTEFQDYGLTTQIEGSFLDPDQLTNLLIIEGEGSILENDQTLADAGITMNTKVLQIVNKTLGCQNDCIANGYSYCVKDNFNLHTTDPEEYGVCCSEATCMSQFEPNCTTGTNDNKANQAFKQVSCQNQVNYCSELETGGSTLAEDPYDKEVRPLPDTNGIIKTIAHNYTEADTEDHVCSYWVKGDDDMGDNDKLWVQINKIENAEVTIYVSDGDSYTYIEEQEFQPIEGMGQYVFGADSIFVHILWKKVYSLETEEEVRTRLEEADTEDNGEVATDESEEPQWVLMPSQVQFETFIEPGASQDKKTQYAAMLDAYYINGQNYTLYNLDSECDYDPKYDNSIGQIWQDDGNGLSKTIFMDYFDSHCWGKTNCTINPEDQDLNLFYLFREVCKDRIKFLDITSYDYIVVVGCQEDDVQIPLIGQSIHKHKVGIFVVVMDMISVMFMGLIFSKVQNINQEYLDIMDDLRVQMKDFGVRFNKVRLDRYTQDSLVQKMKIWLHMTNVLKEHIIEDNDMEVIDVTLSLYTQPSIQLVFRMQEVQIDINDLNNKIYAGVFKDDQEYKKVQEELKDLQAKFKRLEDRYKQLNQKKVKREEKLEVNTARLPKSQRNSYVQYVFVTFKNCETNTVALEIFGRESTMMKCIRTIFCIQRRSSKQNILLMNHKLDIELIIEPDEIIWENLAFSGDEQLIRKIGLYVISLAFLIVVVIFTMYMGGVESLIEGKIPSRECTTVQIPAKDAYLETVGERESVFMYCYCEQIPFFELFTHNFKDVQKELIAEGLLDNETEDTHNYCFPLMFMQFTKQMILFIVTTSAVLVNGIISDFFTYFGKYEMKHTLREEQSTQFIFITLMEFINMGVIQLYQSIDPWKITDRLMGSNVAEKARYTDFTSDWYMSTGTGICYFIFFSSLFTNLIQLLIFLKVGFKRWRDRTFKCNLKMDPEDPDDDTPNTKLKIQQDLENLYTGRDFKGEQTYSRMMSTMFVIQIFCSGMPIMYVIGFIFYTVTYITNKLLLIQFYKKSTTLTRIIPTFSMQLLNWGLVFHMLGACAMLTQPDIFATKMDDTEGISLGIDEQIDDALNVQSDSLHAVQDGSQVDELDFSQKVSLRFHEFYQQLYLVFMILFFLVFIAGKGIIQTTTVITQGLTNIVKVTFNAIVTFMNYICGKLGNCWRKITKKCKKSEVDAEGPEDKDFFGNKDSPGSGEDDGLRQIMKQQSLQEQQEEEAQKREEERERRQRLMRKRMERYDYSDNIYVELNTKNLSNLYERSKREFDDFREFFHWDKKDKIDILEDLMKSEEETHDKEMRTVFLEICFINRIEPKQAKQYQDFLKKRMADIEEVITQHFKLIQETLRENFKQRFEKKRKARQEAGIVLSLAQQMQDEKNEEQELIHNPEMQFDDPRIYNFERKMKLLVQNQDQLIKADKARPNNRRGIQEICRMTGSLTQSYFIFDSQKFKEARKIYYCLGEDDGQINDNDFIDQFVNQNKQEEVGGNDQSGSDEDTELLEGRRSRRSRGSKRSSSKRNNRK